MHLYELEPAAKRETLREFMDVNVSNVNDLISFGDAV